MTPSELRRAHPAQRTLDRPKRNGHDSSERLVQIFGYHDRDGDRRRALAAAPPAATPRPAGYMPQGQKPVGKHYIGMDQSSLPQIKYINMKTTRRVLSLCD
jgi:hypothetical protein